MIVRHTEVEGTTDGGDDELNRPESPQNGQDGAVLVEYGVNSDNMSSCGNWVRRPGWLSGIGMLGIPEQQARIMAVVIGSNR